MTPLWCKNIGLWYFSGPLKLKLKFSVTAGKRNRDLKPNYSFCVSLDGILIVVGYTGVMFQIP